MESHRGLESQKLLGSGKVAELAFLGREAMWNKGGDWGRGSFLLLESS
jgi:hypothetical protein